MRAGDQECQDGAGAGPAGLFQPPLQRPARLPPAPCTTYRAGREPISGKILPCGITGLRLPHLLLQSPLLPP